MSIAPEIAPRQPRTIEEIINPHNLPEAGFQSYTELVNNALDLRKSFIAGEFRNPRFEHSHFHDMSALDRGIIALGQAREVATDRESNSVFRGAIDSSLGFRMAEMEYVKLLGQLEFLHHEGGNQEELSEVQEQARQLGHELYGQPQPEIRDAALNELWNILDGKAYHPTAQVLYDELANGFTWQGQEMPAMLRAEDGEARLPRFEKNEALEWAGEQIIEQNADIQALVQEFWDQKVEENGEGYKCSPADIVEAFQAVINLRDPDHTSGVTVKLVENKTALSWESPEMAVVVGGKRAPIATSDQLFRKVLHEFGVHGQRSINGLKTKLPVLGMGLFTDTPRPDYLTFEEGLATTVEEMNGNDAPEWTAAKLGHYINISLAEQGADFRTVFETAWRYRLLAKLKNNQEVTQEMINKEQRMTYGSCVRIFRGTQPDMADRQPGVVPLTFNKDLAYLEGRVLAMRHLESLYANQDVDGVTRLFAGKYDPTNPKQQELMMGALAA
ncbi:DUF1704 domain-containing protein [Candidatus Saccharibacteria bacterium oral taxon 488]|nr:DUF1704 domain-containing protein [Candidatus Saccharibacteria bacterium oral taxon 488]